MRDRVAESSRAMSIMTASLIGTTRANYDTFRSSRDMRMTRRVRVLRHASVQCRCAERRPRRLRWPCAGRRMRVTGVINQ